MLDCSDSLLTLRHDRSELSPDHNVLFDPHWYAQQNPDLPPERATFGHYLTEGWRNLKSPHPLFSVEYYFEQRPDVKAAGLEPLTHFVTQGWKDGTNPHPAFDVNFYLSQKPDLGGENPLSHYIIRSLIRTFKPNKYFDAQWYLLKNPDVRAAGYEPLTHFVLHGLRERRMSSPEDELQRCSSSDPMYSYLKPVLDFARRSEIHRDTSPAHSTKDIVVHGLIQRLNSFLQSGATIELPSIGDAPPDVSILIVTYNKAYFTLRCLESLVAMANCMKSITTEVIIWDNGSSDETEAVLTRCTNVRTVFGNENLGFLKAVNAAAVSARGRYLLLLNNDTELALGSIESAVSTIESGADIGAVGARLVLPDGTLQEAGSIIWSDGSCLGYARGANPDDSIAMFRRDVDYCSGAFLLTRTELFRRFGGFDEAYAPAYYEETDYCVRLRESGFRVIYDPRVVVFHFEFGSAGPNSWAIYQQQKNRAIFAEKHSAYLAERLVPNPKNALLARDAGKPKRILYIDDRVPYPWAGSGNPRAMTVIEAIRNAIGVDGYVTLLATDNIEPDWPAIWRALGVDTEVLFAHDKAKFRAILTERLDMYDAIWVSRPHNIMRVNEILDASATAPKLIYDAEAIFSLRDQLKQSVLGAPTETRSVSDCLREEMELARHASNVVAVSASEAAVFNQYLSADVHILGHALATTPSPKSFADREGFLFVGAVHSADSPNGDSLLWFFKEVWPILVSKLGRNPKMTVVGVNKAREVEATAPEGVVFLGAVDDLSDVFNDCRVFVAPTRYAAGIPHKVHQAATFGMPSVVTPLLANQLGWADSREIMVGRTPEEFAAASAQLYKKEKLWRAVREAGLRAVQQDCDPTQFAKTVVHICHSAASGC
jgi:GT2 family glycosyltransferase